MKVCFYANVHSPDVVERNEFYSQDLRILRDMGLEVSVCTNWRSLPTDVDLYFVWWWQWAFVPLMKNLLAKKPCIVTGVFNYQLPTHKDYLHRPLWEQWLMRYSAARASANIFLSETERRIVTGVLPVKNDSYIPLGVDTELYRPGKGPREDFVLSIAWMNGSNWVRKCVPEILASAPLVIARHPQVRYLIVGEKGKGFEQLQSMADESSVADHIEFLGVVPREVKIDLLQRCKVFLSPSRFEGFGLAILEAMSCGAPVVTSAAGAIPEVVGDTQLMAPADSVEQIATAVNRYLDDPALRERASIAGRNRAQEKFSYERRRRELRAVVESVLGGSIKPAARGTGA